MLAICLLARLYTLAHTDNIAVDGATLLSMAMRLAQSPTAAIHEFPHHPGYPALVAFAAKAVGASGPVEWALTGQVVTIVLSLLAVGCLYGIAALLFDHSIALLSALMFGLCPEVGYLCADALSDIPALAWGLLSLMLALYAVRDDRRPKLLPVILGGLAGGLAYLTRPEYLLCPALGVLVLLLAPKRSFLALGLYVGVCAALCGPYAIAIGGFTNKKGVHDFVLAQSAAATLTAGVGHDFYQVFKRSAQIISAPPLVLLHVYVLGRIASRFWPAIKTQFVALQHRRLQWLLIAPLLLMTPLLMSLEERRGPGYIDSRHMLLPSALLFVYAALGLVLLVEVLSALMQRLRRAPATGAILVTLLVIVIGANMPRVVRPLQVGKAIFRQAGSKLLAEYGPGHYVLSSDSRVAFFAASPLQQFTHGTDMPSLLRPEYLKSAESLRSALAERHGRRYEFLAIAQNVITDASTRGPLDALAGRLIPLFSGQSPGTRPQAVMVFEIKAE